MKVYELNEEQYAIICQRLLTEIYDLFGKTPSWYLLSKAAEIVDREIVFDLYDGTLFTEEDF